MLPQIIFSRRLLLTCPEASGLHLKFEHRCSLWSLLVQSTNYYALPPIAIANSVLHGVDEVDASLTTMGLMMSRSLKLFNDANVVEEDDELLGDLPPPQHAQK